MFRTPQKKDIKINEISGPFDTTVWCLMAIYVMSCTILMSLFFQYESKDTKDIRYSNSFLVTIGSLCQQGMF